MVRVRTGFFRSRVMTDVILYDLDEYTIYPGQVVDLNGVYSMERLSCSESLHFYLCGGLIEEVLESRFKVYQRGRIKKKCGEGDVLLLGYDSRDIIFVGVKR